jgi:hypothetical protein
MLCWAPMMAFSLRLLLSGLVFLASFPPALAETGQPPDPGRPSDEARTPAGSSAAASPAPPPVAWYGARPERSVDSSAATSPLSCKKLGRRIGGDALHQSAQEALFVWTGRPQPPDQQAVWAELLKRVSSTDVLTCSRCGGRTVRIAWITSGDAIHRILTAVELATDAPPVHPPGSAEDRFGMAA